MSDLSYFVIVEPDSGTFFGADRAYLIDTRALNPEELEMLNEGSDQQRGMLCLQHGIDLEDKLKL